MEATNRIHTQPINKTIPVFNTAIFKPVKIEDKECYSTNEKDAYEIKIIFKKLFDNFHDQP